MCASTNLRAWRVLLVLGILAILTHAACAATFPNVTFHMQDFTTGNLTNKEIDVYPYSVPFNTNSAIVTDGVRKFRTDVTGSFLVTNMVPGCYNCKPSGSWTFTPFDICFTNATGDLNAHDLLTSAVTVVDANKKFVQHTSGILSYPTNFLTANIFPGLNVVLHTNSLGQITIDASTNGVSIANAVIHNGSGVLVTPTNFFHGNLLLGTNMVFETNALGQITISSSASGSASSAYTNNIEIWLSTRTDADGDGSIGNPLRADTDVTFDSIMRGYASQSNLTFRLHPGQYFTRGWSESTPIIGWQIKRNWKIQGAGMDRTTLTLTNTAAGSAVRLFYIVIGCDHDVDTSYSEVSDLTVDCNLDNLTTSVGGHTNKTIAAVKLNGSHTAIRRVKAIHYGADGVATAAVNDDVFVLSAAATFPQHAPRASHTIIEDCVLLYPSKLTTHNIVEFIHTSGAMNVANDMMAFATNIIIRNNYIDGRFEDGTIKTRAFNPQLWHGLTMGSCDLGLVEGNTVINVDVAGNYQDSFRTRSIIVRNNLFQDVDGGGLWTFTGADGEPAGGLAIAGLTSSGTTATLTVDQPLHDLIPGIDIVQVKLAGDEAFNGDFLVKDATDTTIIYEMASTPSDDTPSYISAKWRVHRGVRDIQYTGNTTFLRHSGDVSYAVGMIGPSTNYNLPFFHTVLVANNYFAFSDGKATNNPGPNTGIHIHGARNCIVHDNLFNLYTNLNWFARLNVYVRDCSNFVVFNNRSVDGTPEWGYDGETHPVVPDVRLWDHQATLQLRIYETNNGPDYTRITGGVMPSNVFWVLPTTNGASGNVLMTDGGHPAKLSWGSGSSGISLLDGFGTNLTLRASTNIGSTNLILRALTDQDGDMLSVISAGGNIVAALTTNGAMRLRTGTTTNTSISRYADYGDGISFDVDITRFLFNTNEVANIGNTTGFAHKSDTASLVFGAGGGDMWLSRIAAGAANFSSTNNTTDGVLQLARVRFVENQGENTQYVEFLATNMSATMVNFWPQTNAQPGQFLTSRVLSGITNIWYWTNAPSVAAASTSFIGDTNGHGTNIVFFEKLHITTNSALVLSNITSVVDFQNSRLLNGLGIWTNSETTTEPFVINSLASTTTNLFTIRSNSLPMIYVDGAGKLRVSDGTTNAPTISRMSDAGDGFSLADGTFDFSVNSNRFARILAAGVNAGFTHEAATPSLVFGPTAGTVLTGNGGEWTASTSTTAATGAGLGSLNATNVTVRGALKMRENETGTTDGILTLKMPPGVEIANFTTYLWTANGTPGQALKTDGTQLYWEDVGGVAPGIAATDGTGLRTTFTSTVATTNVTVKGFLNQTAPLQSWVNSSGAALASMSPTGTVSLLTDNAFLSMGLTNDVKLSRLGPGDFRFDRVGSDGRGGIQVSNINVIGTLTNNGPVTYTVQGVTQVGGATPRGLINGGLGNLFKVTLTESTNLFLTNLLAGPLTVIITNPSTYTVTWNLLTNQWLGSPVNFQPVQQAPGVTYWTFFREGNQTNGSAVHQGVPINKIETITSLAAMVLNFSKNPDQLLILTNDVSTWSTAGKVAGVRTISLTIDANGSDRTFGTWPANWRWQTTMPTGIGATNQGVLNLRSRTTTDSEVMAAWNPQL